MTGQQVALMIGGILVVFLVLAVLILFISIMGSIFTSLAKRSAPKATPANDVPDAAFVAAVSAAINKINPVDDDRSIRIKSIRKV
ncbi:MAG: OadG family protein [Clostridia bacterium]|nr:OadG family protein [Clostridia bacterium]